MCLNVLFLSNPPSWICPHCITEHQGLWHAASDLTSSVHGSVFTPARSGDTKITSAGCCVEKSKEIVCDKWSTCAKRMDRINVQPDNAKLEDMTAP